MNRIYLDNSATTRTDDRVIDDMILFMREGYGNPSSLHSFGREANRAVQEARQRVAGLIGAQPDEIIFTSGGTESDNLALKGYALANGRKGGHIITSSIEHHAVLEPCRYLEKIGFEVTFLPVDEFGMISTASVEEAIRKDTVLISIMHANNEIGTVQPIDAIAKLANEKGVPFHTDAVQTVGRIPLDVSNGISMLSMSGHKFHGPKGVGALFVRKGIRLETQMHGGGQEKGVRSSTENVPAIVGMGKAAEIAGEEFDAESRRQVRIRDMIIDGVLESVPRSFLNGHRSERLPNNAHFRFDFIEGEGIVLHLDMRGIAVSTGSACSTSSLEPSHVLLATGLMPHQAHGSLRISLGRFNTEEEARIFLDNISEVVSILREMSPYNENNPIAPGGDQC
ncbi:MAG TPA: cysteine desulfurase NifS [Euryarchaeota archaeon]|nr:cysteine desulfurase NifS [Euryarchaeota archaeon]